MTHEDQARKQAAMPSGSSACLNTRSLAASHKRLSTLLRPGMSVLDVGCGTGAITRGIAEAVGPSGRVVGVDVNAELIAQARERHADVPALSFHVADAYALPFAHEFDVVTAARMLQWLSDPAAALNEMITAVRPGGMVVVLDYNHRKLVWEPAVPASVGAFYKAFLTWRADAGMDNAIADRLAGLFAAGGLAEITVTPQHEVAERGQDDFAERTGIWQAVIRGRGGQMVANGHLSEAERASAERNYRSWLENHATLQRMYLLAVEGRVPNGTTERSQPHAS